MPNDLARKQGARMSVVSGTWIAGLTLFTVLIRLSIYQQVSMRIFDSVF
jgi:hypothetical protein